MSPSTFLSLLANILLLARPGYCDWVVSDGMVSDEKISSRNIVAVPVAKAAATDVPDMTVVSYSPVLVAPSISSPGAQISMHSP